MMRGFLVFLFLLSCTLAYGSNIGTESLLNNVYDSTTETLKVTISGNADMDRITADSVSCETITVDRAVADELTADVVTISRDSAEDGNRTIFTIISPDIANTSMIPGLELRNPKSATASVTTEFSPSLILSGNGWVTGANMVQKWGMQARPSTTASSSELAFAYFINNTWALNWFSMWADGTAGFLLLNIGESIPSNSQVFKILNTTAATSSVDQYSPAIRFASQGWKTAATAASQTMNLYEYIAPEQGTTSAKGVFKYAYGTAAAPSDSNELIRWVWGDDVGNLGTVVNENSLNNYVFRVEGDTQDRLLVVNGSADTVTAYKLSVDTITTVSGDLTAFGVLTANNATTALTIGNAAAGVDYRILVDGENNNGVLTWMEDEGYFEYTPAILMAGAEEVYFRDTALSVNSATDGHLDLNADTSIDLNAFVDAVRLSVDTTATISGDTAIFGTLSVDSATVNMKLSNTRMQVSDGAYSSPVTATIAMFQRTGADAGFTVSCGANKDDYINFGEYGVSEAQGWIGYNTNTNRMNFRVNNTNVMTIDSTGYVGINGATQMPLVALQVNGEVSADAVKFNPTNMSPDVTTGCFVIYVSSDKTIGFYDGTVWKTIQTY